MFINRRISTEIVKSAGLFPAVVLTGARQVGKTTLLQHLFPKYTYISLDSISDAEMAEYSPDLFFEKYPAPLIIDEIQYSPGLFRSIKVQIDKNRERNGQFIVTGSQKFSLMHGISESLAGRCAVLELQSLATSEIPDHLASQIVNQAYEKILARGLFPELWKVPEFPELDFYRSYLATYIERDVRQIINITSTRDFNRFVRSVAIRSGQLLNKLDLAKDVGISAKTISNWLSIMEASNQLTLLEPFHSNMSKRLIKSPKIYLNETGLLSFILGLDAKSLAAYHGIGHIWEAFILSELRKLLSFSLPHANVFFYRDKDGKEVNFVVEVGGQVHLLEIKWTQSPDKRTLKRLDQIGKKFGKQLGCKIVICRSSDTYRLKDDTIVMPGLKLGIDLIKHLQRTP